MPLLAIMSLLMMIFDFAGCGELDSIGPGEAITLRTTNYPGNYTNNQKCIWAVTCIGSKSPLTLNFTTFNVQNSTNCVKDFVHIKDGTRTNSTLLATLCGPSLATTVYKSTGPQLQVNMITDASVVQKGFEAVVSCPGNVERFS